MATLARAAVTARVVSSFLTAAMSGPHDDPASKPGHAHHLSGYIKRLWCKYGPKNTHD
jgi:hypothetical protein